jgi:hypothetical protein
MDTSSKKFKRAIVRAGMAVVFIVLIMLISTFVSKVVGLTLLLSGLIGALVFIFSYTNPYENDE